LGSTGNLRKTDDRIRNLTYAILEPVYETLVLYAMLFTLLGFFAGKFLHWFAGTK